MRWRPPRRNNRRGRPRQGPATAARSSEGPSSRRGGRAGQDPLGCGDKDEDERHQVKDLADRVGEQEHGPVEVIGHVADLGQGEQAEGRAEHGCAHRERAPGEVGTDEERGQVDQQEYGRGDLVDEISERHYATPSRAWSAASRRARLRWTPKLTTPARIRTMLTNPPRCADDSNVVWWCT